MLFKFFNQVYLNTYLIINREVSNLLYVQIIFTYVWFEVNEGTEWGCFRIPRLYPIHEYF